MTIDDITIDDHSVEAFRRGLNGRCCSPATRVSRTRRGCGTG